MSGTAICPRCGDPLTYANRTFTCPYCDHTHELDNYAIDAINEVITSNRQEVTAAFFNSAYYLNRMDGSYKVDVSHGVSIDPLDFIAFAFLAIEQAESGENDQNV